MTAPRRPLVCWYCGSELTMCSFEGEDWYEDSDGEARCLDADDPTWHGHEPYRPRAERSA